jgi:signal transduction histidine kinase
VVENKGDDEQMESKEEIEDEAGADYQFISIKVTKEPFNFKNCYMFAIQDLTEVINRQRKSSEAYYQQLMVSTMAHEYLTPLNALLNISEQLLLSENGNRILDHNQKLSYLEAIMNSS